MLTDAHVVGQASASSPKARPFFSLFPKSLPSLRTRTSQIPQVLFKLSWIMLLGAAVINCLPINDEPVRQQQANDAVVSGDDRTEAPSDGTSQIDNRLVKHVASITRYRINPKSRLQSSNVRKEVNLMIIPMSSIIIFIVLLAISVSRWCVEDVRYNDVETNRRRFHGVMMTPLQQQQQGSRQRTSNDYVEAVRAVSSRTMLRRHCSSPAGTSMVCPAGNRLLVGTTTNERSVRRHASSRPARTRTHTADGRRRDRMSTTSIPLAELLSTTMAPLIIHGMHGGRGALRSTDKGRLNALLPGDGDDIVECYREDDGHVFVLPVAPPPAAGLPTAQRTHRRNSSSLASSASLNGSTAATASSWCSDSNPLEGPGASRSNSESIAIIDASTPDLVLSSSPQLVRASGRRGGSIKHHATARKSRFQRETRLRQFPQLIQTTGSSTACRLAQDGLNINMRVFQFSLGDARYSTIVTPYDSSDSVFMRSVSVDNDETCYSESGAA